MSNFVLLALLFGVLGTTVLANDDFPDCYWGGRCFSCLPGSNVCCWSCALRKTNPKMSDVKKSTYYGSPAPVSAHMNCYTGSSCTQTVTRSVSKSTTFTGSVSGSFLGWFAAQAGVSYTRGSSSGDQYSCGLKEGQSGYITFSPKMQRVEANVYCSGDRYCKGWSRSGLVMDTPVLLSNGQLDGEFTCHRS